MVHQYNAANAPRAPLVCVDPHSSLPKSIYVHDLNHLSHWHVRC